MLAPAADATYLTYRLAAHENACFYTMVPEAGKKVALYFAVSRGRPVLESRVAKGWWGVQSGGSFDIDYTVSDPKSQVLLSGQKERQGDYVLTANHVGEYSVCFSNRMSTFVDKVVDFEITAEDEHNPALADAKKAESIKGASKEHTTRMYDTSKRISDNMWRIQRLQKIGRPREHRSMATVQSTESRIFYFAVFESAMIITVAVTQVFIIRTFFGVTKKGGV
ncbi:MAG: putative endosomal cargo receptor [Olpidium bornovanus]|uniref:Endosomal cargo receptor n=1 Tax=Olpidium bornovanus TaxID=278681 RepID=A0A8H8A242_9FUNG|nr:MAG: putative endosomal cargo receptor [Olpidium bornovanus]